MDTQSNKKIIQRILADFAAGRVESLLAAISEDVVWELPHTHRAYPIRPSYTGRDATLQLLEDVGALSDVSVFEPREFIAEGDAVVVITHEVATVKATGRTHSQDFVQVWTLRDGKIVRCRVFEDTYGAVQAFTG